MANGVSGTKRGSAPAAQTQSTNPEASNYVSEYSTGGKIEKTGSDTWEAVNDNGSGVVILDTGKSDINLYKYGSKQIYEVQRYESDAAKANGADDPPKLHATTKAEAMQLAKGWLKANNGQMHIIGLNWNPLQVQVENAGKKKK